MRAILEGVCFEIEKNIRIIETLTQPITQVRVSGGAARFPLFNQMQADVYGKIVLRGISEQSSALGAMLVTAIAIGLYPDITTAAEAVIAFDAHNRKIPDERAHQIYTTMLTLHDELYAALSAGNIYAKAAALRELLQNHQKLA